MKFIGVLGYGSIGKRHVANLQNLPGCQVRYWDPDHPYDWTREKLIDQSDALVIASPTDQHWADINDCRRAEKPCFVEKPVGHMPADITTSHVKMVGYNLRFHSCVKKVREWLGKGKISQPIWANFNCAQYNDRYPHDDVIFNWSHEIDLALHLLGPVYRVLSCATKGGGTSTMADIVIAHRENCQSSVHLDYLTRPERRGFTIGSNEGVIEVDLVTRQASVNYSNGTAEIFNGQDSFDENYLDEMKAFLMRLEGQPALGCTAQEGLDALDICLKAKEMAK